MTTLVTFNGYVVKARKDGTFDVDFNDGDAQKNMTFEELRPWPKRKKPDSHATDCLVDGKLVAPVTTRASSRNERKKCAVISFYVRGDFLSCPFAHDPGYDVLLGYEINEQYRHAWSLNHPGGTCRVQDILALSPADFVQDAESHGAFTGEYDELLLMFTPDCSSGSSADGIPVDLAYYERVMKHAIDVIRALNQKLNVTFVFEFLNKSYVVDALEQAFPNQIETLTTQQHLLELRERTFTMGRFPGAQRLLDAIEVPPASLLSSPPPPRRRRRRRARAPRRRARHRSSTRASSTSCASTCPSRRACGSTRSPSPRSASARPCSSWRRRFFTLPSAKCGARAVAGPAVDQVRDGQGPRPLHPGPVRADDHVGGARGAVLRAGVFLCVLFVDRHRDAPGARGSLPLSRALVSLLSAQPRLAARYPDGTELPVPVAALLALRNLGAAHPYVLSPEYFTPHNKDRNPTLARKIVGAAVSGIVSSGIMDVFFPVFFFSLGI